MLNNRNTSIKINTNIIILHHFLILSPILTLEREEEKNF